MRMFTAAFVLSLLIPATRPASAETGPLLLSLPNDKKLCVVSAGGPVAVSFTGSMTLIQAIKEARVVRSEVKNRVYIIRRKENGIIEIIKVDLLSIEKQRTSDIRLLEYDVVGLMYKKKLPIPTDDALLNGCLSCGCRIVPSMHGPLILP